MIEILDRLSQSGALTQPALLRALFLWQSLLGAGCDAADRLRRMTGPLIQLPPTAEVTPLDIPIRPCPDGLDVHEAALPGADVVFAHVTEEGLRLRCAIDPLPDGRKLRRLQVLDADGAGYRRRDRERFLLRYRLPAAAMQARELMFVAICLGANAPSASRAGFRLWAELDVDGMRHVIEPGETATTGGTHGELFQLISFPQSALTSRWGSGGAGYFCMELSADVPQIELLGEVLVGGA